MVLLVAALLLPGFCKSETEVKETKFMSQYVILSNDGDESSMSHNKNLLDSDYAMTRTIILRISCLVCR